ncbi:musculoskeletal embryonic nuclear protein 1b isoform X6 [Entelurus aequoreus]|uniref:musculoskeletal embryonic nuclear protein 1b isoform X6 n=1 Tax=Entelurus aequoreus TaxID=161455 RepID=UPI002B1E7DE4|nr:musculoskeletal embryonic nuclear protein 1b isoform X6 [Entelurus aequoreus]
MSQKRTYPSGAEKRKKKKVEEEKKCHDKGALLKYFGGTESAQSQSTSSGSTCSLTHLHPLCPLSPPCLKPQLIYLQLPPQRPLHTMDHHQLRQLTQLSGLLSSQIQTGLSSKHPDWTESSHRRLRCSFRCSLSPTGGQEVRGRCLPQWVMHHKQALMDRSEGGA